MRSISPILSEGAKQRMPGTFGSMAKGLEGVGHEPHPTAVTIERVVVGKRNWLIQFCLMSDHMSFFSEGWLITDLW
jgi:hypothetical protein